MKRHEFEEPTDWYVHKTPYFVRVGNSGGSIEVFRWAPEEPPTIRAVGLRWSDSGVPLSGVYVPGSTEELAELVFHLTQFLKEMQERDK